MYSVRRVKLVIAEIYISNFVPDFASKKVFKVTRYLQRCLAFKRCSASSLNCRYLNPYVKLKLIELTIKPYQEF